MNLASKCSMKNATIFVTLWSIRDQSPVKVCFELNWIRLLLSLQVFLTNVFEEDNMIQRRTETVCIGTIPVMVNSSFCHLHGLTEAELVAKGQCLFDAGGYFIIKGSEKVRN